jgi:uncharacterized protein (TIGR02453 family)
MISKETYQFLKDLQNNNYKEWFQENRKTYDACRQHFVHVVELLIHEVSQFDRSVSGNSPKNCIFRINRDVRFSKDKSPYKTNFGAFITPGGRNAGKAGYYLHVEPEGSFLAGGIYMPPSPVLKAIRKEIFENYEEFLEIIKEKDFVKYYGDFEGERLKRCPRGFPEDFEGIEYLKLKHFTVMDSKPDKDLMNADFFNTAIEEFEALYPLNRFLNNIETQ